MKALRARLAALCFWLGLRLTAPYDIQISVHIQIPEGYDIDPNVELPPGWRDET